MTRVLIYLKVIRLQPAGALVFLAIGLLLLLLTGPLGPRPQLTFKIRRPSTIIPV